MTRQSRSALGRWLRLCLFGCILWGCATHNDAGTAAQADAISGGTALHHPRWDRITSGHIYWLDETRGELRPEAIAAHEDVIVMRLLDGLGLEGQWAEVRRIVASTADGRYPTLGPTFYAPYQTLELKERAPEARGFAADAYVTVVDCPVYTLHGRRLAPAPLRGYQQLEAEPPIRFMQIFGRIEDDSKYVLVGKRGRATGWISRQCIEQQELLAGYRLWEKQHALVNTSRKPTNWPGYTASFEEAFAEYDPHGEVPYPFENDPDVDTQSDYCSSVTYPLAGGSYDIQNVANAAHLQVDHYFLHFGVHISGIADAEDFHPEERYDALVHNGLIAGVVFLRAQFLELHPGQDEGRGLQDNFCKALKRVAHCMWLRGFHQMIFAITKESRYPGVTDTARIHSLWRHQTVTNFLVVPTLSRPIRSYDQNTAQLQNLYWEQAASNAAVWTLGKAFYDDPTDTYYYIDLTQGFHCAPQGQP